jgi:hypothetical protein
MPCLPYNDPVGALDDTSHTKTDIFEGNMCSFTSSYILLNFLCTQDHYNSAQFCRPTHRNIYYHNPYSTQKWYIARLTTTSNVFTDTNKQPSIHSGNTILGLQITTYP